MLFSKMLFEPVTGQKNLRHREVKSRKFRKEMMGMIGTRIGKACGHFEV